MKKTTEIAAFPAESSGVAARGMCKSLPTLVRIRGEASIPRSGRSGLSMCYDDLDRVYLASNSEIIGSV